MNINRQELSKFPNHKTNLDANGVNPVDKIRIFTDHILELKKGHTIKISTLTQVTNP